MQGSPPGAGRPRGAGGTPVGGILSARKAGGGELSDPNPRHGKIISLYMGRRGGKNPFFYRQTPSYSGNVAWIAVSDPHGHTWSNAVGHQSATRIVQQVWCEAHDFPASKNYIKIILFQGHRASTSW